MTARDDSPVYWRIYWPESAPMPAVVCMQWFDEADYDQERFIGAAWSTERAASADLAFALRHLGAGEQTTDE